MSQSAFKTVMIALATAMLAGGLVYFVMHEQIAQLMAENQRLRAQVAELTRDSDAAAARLRDTSDPEQREKERTELLRLRGEIGVLRKQKGELEKLRQENDALTAALTKLSQSSAESSPEPEPDPERRQAMVRLNDARQLVLGLIMFAEDHQGTLPSSLHQTSNYWGTASHLFTNQFELMLQRPLKELDNPSTTIIIREQTAWQHKGNWVKTYGFADGHSELKKEPPEGFEAWEKLHVPPASPGR